MTGTEHRMAIAIETDEIMENVGDILTALDTIRAHVFSAGLTVSEREGMVLVLQNLQGLVADVEIKAQVMIEDMQAVERGDAAVINPNPEAVRAS